MENLKHITCSVKNITIGAGIIFESSHLKDFTITNCSLTIANSVNNHAGRATAIQIIECSQLVVSSVLVLNSSQGLTFIDTQSSVHVMDSQFTNNSIQNHKNWPGGCGLQILFVNMNQNNDANYLILRNRFEYNTATSQKASVYRYASKGGGIRILLFSECSFSLYLNDIYQNEQLHFLLDNITIFNTTFLNNSATFDGGVFYILLRLTSVQSVP